MNSYLDCFKFHPYKRVNLNLMKVINFFKEAGILSFRAIEIAHSKHNINFIGFDFTSQKLLNPISKSFSNTSF